MPNQISSFPSLDTIEYARPRFPILDLSPNVSEPDSLIDLYKYRRTVPQTPIAPDFLLTIIPPNLVMAARSPIEVEDQEAKWIHRDKLTQIEIQEYRDRGLQPPADLLKRAAHGGESVRSRQAKYPDINTNNSKIQQAQSLESPPISPHEEFEEYDEEASNAEDPRTSEELAEEELYEDDSAYTMSKLRASSSKIPLATSSPLPIPVEHLERDTPLRRRRETSDEWDEDYTPQLRMRSRGNSMGSQVLLDDEVFDSPGSAPSSPPRNRNQAKIRAPSASNKLTNNKQRTDARHVRTSSGQRPGSRSGTHDRPRTAAHRPEGDPPWMDQMFKPDPMLPPDQQMLPTHAKRMMAERWEKEGKVGSVYDRELSPVQIYDETKMKPYLESKDPHVEQQWHAEPQNQREEETSQLEPSNNVSSWPLKPVNTLDVPRTPNPDHGGYSTMPKVQKTASIIPPPSPRPIDQSFQFEQEKQEKKKGGCGCCVVM